MKMEPWIAATIFQNLSGRFGLTLPRLLKFEQEINPSVTPEELHKRMKEFIRTNGVITAEWDEAITPYFKVYRRWGEEEIKRYMEEEFARYNADSYYIGFIRCHDINRYVTRIWFNTRVPWTPERLEVLLEEGEGEVYADKNWMPWFKEMYEYE